MGNRLTYPPEDSEDLLEEESKLELCKEIILSCLPNYSYMSIKKYEDIRLFYQSLSDEQFQLAFKSQKMNSKYYLLILQTCDMAYNTPSLQLLISTLLGNKIFFSFSKHGAFQRRLSKNIINQALIKELKENLPKELISLATDTYFHKFLNEGFLSIEKDKIIGAVDKYLDLYNLKDEALSEKFGLNDVLFDFESARMKMMGNKTKFKKYVEIYKKKKEFQDFAKLEILKTQDILKADDKTIENTYFGFL